VRHNTGLVLDCRERLHAFDHGRRFASVSEVAGEGDGFDTAVRAGFLKGLEGG
jgi:hypothetical protein